MGEYKSEWSDDLRKTVVEQYLAAEPTPENTMEIIKELAEEHDKTPNGVRMILVKEGAYIKKEQVKAPKKEGAKGTRVNKAEAISGLKQALEDAKLEINDDIIDRLTGKAAVYFTDVIVKAQGKPF
jgi:hypothetical protein